MKVKRSKINIHHGGVGEDEFGNVVGHVAVVVGKNSETVDL